MFFMQITDYIFKKSFNLKIIYIPLCYIEKRELII